MRSAPSRRIDLAVEIAVLDHVAHQRGVLRRLAEPLRKRHRGGEALLRGLRQRLQHRRGEDAGRDRVDADAELRELARRRHDQADDAALRRRVGGLADLAFVGGDRRGPDDDAALAVGERLERSAWRRRRAACALKVPIRLIAMTRSKSASGIGPSRPTMRLAGPMPAQLTRMRAGPCSAARLGEGGLGRGAVGHVAMDGDAVDVDRHLGRGLLIDVEDRHLGAGVGQHARGGGAEAGGAAGDDRGVSSNIHGQLARSAFWLAVGRDDVRRRRVGVKLFHQSGAMRKHRALVDRALVGHLAGVERRRLGEQDGAADAGRGAGAGRSERIEQAREFAAHARIGEHCGRRRVGRRDRAQACGRRRDRETPAR